MDVQEVVHLFVHGRGLGNGNELESAQEQLEHKERVCDGKDGLKRGSKTISEEKRNK